MFSEIQIEHGYKGDLLDGKSIVSCRLNSHLAEHELLVNNLLRVLLAAGMLLRFQILEEARRRWPEGMGTSQDYAKWESRHEL